MWTTKFWKDAVERAVKTTAQTLLGSIVGWNIASGETDWVGVLIVTGTAAGLSFVTSILSSLAGSSTSASAVE